MNTNPFTRLWRKVNKVVASWFYIDQWVILTSTTADYRSLKFDQFQRLIPPPDRYWADPFVVERDGQYFIFIEEKLYKTGLGRIACLRVDPNGSLLSNETVLERSYHLSYPFLFEHSDELYMLPESAANRTLELYRCVNFPNEWVFEKKLMSDIYITDATLLEHDGKWWLFANIKAEGGSSLDALHLFSSDSPISGDWVPHPKNPVVKDIHSARPAGHIFKDGEKLIRPSQDSSKRYGYALNFNEITILDKANFEEKTVTHFVPPERSNILAVHTWNTAKGMQTSDAVIRRRK